MPLANDNKWYILYLVSHLQLQVLCKADSAEWPGPDYVQCSTSTVAFICLFYHVSRSPLCSLLSDTVESLVFWHSRFLTPAHLAVPAHPFSCFLTFVVVFWWVGFLFGCVLADLAVTSSLQKLILLRKIDLLNAIYPEMRTDFIAFLSLWRHRCQKA